MFISRHEDVAAPRGAACARSASTASHAERAVPGMYDVPSLGLNYRMSEIQAALGRSQLARIDEILERRRANFEALVQARSVDCPPCACSTGPATATTARRSCSRASSRERRDDVLRLIGERGHRHQRVLPAARAADDVLPREVRLRRRALSGRGDDQRSLDRASRRAASRAGRRRRRSPPPSLAAVEEVSCRVAVVGGAGFIGHHLALELAARGTDVARRRQPAGEQRHRRRDRRAATRRTATCTRASSTSGSTCCATRTCPCTSRTRATTTRCRGCSTDIAPTVIVHGAAVSHAGQSNKDPYSTFDHSLRTLENALDWSRSPRRALRLPLVEHGLRELPHPRGRRGRIRSTRSASTAR